MTNILFSFKGLSLAQRHLSDTLSSMNNLHVAHILKFAEAWQWFLVFLDWLSWEFPSLLWFWKYQSQLESLGAIDDGQIDQSVLEGRAKLAAEGPIKRFIYPRSQTGQSINHPKHFPHNWKSAQSSRTAKVNFTRMCNVKKAKSRAIELLKSHKSEMEKHKSAPKASSTRRNSFQWPLLNADTYPRSRSPNEYTLHSIGIHKDIYSYVCIHILHPHCWVIINFPPKLNFNAAEPAGKWHSKWKRKLHRLGKLQKFWCE